MISRRKAAPRKRVRSRKPRSAGVKNLTALIKKVVLRTAETKFVVRNLDNVVILHDIPQILDQNMTNITQGVGDDQRIGDACNLKSLHMRIMVSTTSKPNVMYKFWVVRTPLNNGTSLPYTYPTWFKNYLGVWPLDPMNTDLVTVIATKSGKVNGGNTDYSIEAGSTVYDTTKFIDWKIDLKNRRQDFAQDAGLFPKDHCYQLLVAAYDSLGTLVSQPILRVQYSAQLFFKDP